MTHSKITSKRKVVYNGTELTEEEGALFDSEFDYSFTLSKHKMRIKQINDVFYELTIDGKTFEQMMINSNKINF